MSCTSCVCCVHLILTEHWPSEKCKTQESKGGVFPVIAPDSNGKTSSYQRVMIVSSQDKRHRGLWKPRNEPNTADVEAVSIWMVTWAKYFIVNHQTQLLPSGHRTVCILLQTKKRIDSSFSFKMNHNSWVLQSLSIVLFGFAWFFTAWSVVSALKVTLKNIF